MQLHDFGRRTAAGTGNVLKCGEDSGKSPFTETREAVAVISPSFDWQGGSAKFQASADGGTTWTDLWDVSDLTKGQVQMKGITLPNQIRLNITGITGGSYTAYLMAAGS